MGTNLIPRNRRLIMDHDYDVQIDYVDGAMEIIRVQCRDKSSPITAIEKAIKALKNKQRITCNYRQIVGMKIVSIKAVELL